MTTRQILRRAFSIAAIPFVVILYFNIENLATRLGWADVLADAIYPTTGRSPVVEFLKHPVTLWCALLGLGFLAGLWVDAILAKRERDGAPDSLVERQRLATETRELASKVAGIYGQFASRSSAEWRQNAVSARQSGEAWARENISESAALETYNRNCASKAWEIIGAAQTLVKLDHSEIWMVSHGTHSVSDINSMAQLLSKIAARLIYQGDPIPMAGGYEERMAANQGVTLEPQSPQDTGSETPP